MRIRTTLVGIVALVYLCQPGQRIVATPLFQGSAEYYYQQGNEYLNKHKMQNGEPASRFTVLRFT